LIRISRDIPSIDLNADLGEGFPWDEELLTLVSSASVCCGAHAGSIEHSQLTVARAASQGVIVGAHPGYADRARFGREPMALSSSEVRQLIVDQVGALQSLAEAEGSRIRYVKPHGALYNQAQVDPQVARGVIEAVSALGLPVLGLPGGVLARELAMKATSVRFIAEGFADRRYTDEGTLVPRTQAGAILTDEREIRDQAARLISGGQIETLCLHGDDTRCVESAQLLRRVLAELGVSIRPFLEPSE
jgi:UPF0271 protein